MTRDAETRLPERQIARFRADLEALTGPVERIGVAVSGGPDSVALLLLAHATFPGRVRAATIDHGLRPEAADEARFVATLCDARAIPHAILPVSVTPDGDGVQAAARAARYAALGQWGRTQDIPCLLTGHHADDQAETVLMRLSRGTGVAGLTGVRRIGPPGDSPRIVRPLLGWRRAELHAIVAAAGIIAIDDPSNRDPHFDRTRARALLGETEWLDAGRIAAAADHLADAEEALAWIAREAARSRLKQRDNRVEIDVEGLPREIVRRMLAAALSTFDEAPDGPALARAIARLNAGRAATLGAVKVSPGSPWWIAQAPPRRAN